MVGGAVSSVKRNAFFKRHVPTKQAGQQRGGRRNARKLSVTKFRDAPVPLSADECNKTVRSNRDQSHPQTYRNEGNHVQTNPIRPKQSQYQL